jgi:hypothetical protein
VFLVDFQQQPTKNKRQHGIADGEGYCPVMDDKKEVVG